jgi:alanyl-tRNA synthetase
MKEARFLLKKEKICYISSMNSSEIRQRFLEFFKKRGHTIIPSASLVTPDEKGLTNATLFNTAGMQPLIPYLLGKPYVIDGKEVTRLVNVQKCLRTVDIDDIGDKVHATFFEMLGNWSLGDYFKKEAIEWSYEFLTSKKEGLGLDPSRLYITVFEGDSNAPRDDEAADIWRDIFKKNKVEGERIFFMPASTNWWEAGDNGPCGPDTEMYYDIGNTFKGKGITQEQFIKADESRDVIEVWNDVFMQYEKKDGKIIGNLPKPSVDTGAGLERLAMTLQGVDNIYDTDLLKPVMEKIKEFSNNWNVKSARIVADHIRAAVFLIADGISPSNVGRGYVLRRLTRRAVRYADALGLKQSTIIELSACIVETYKKTYTNLNTNGEHVGKELLEEETKFRETAKKGFNEFKKRLNEKGTLTTQDIFDLYQSFGLSKDQLEETLNEIKEVIADSVAHKVVKPIMYDEKEFNVLVKKHQDLSRSSASQKFKGGLADANDPMVVRYHTATHLLQQALHDVLGEEVGNQKGSNITAERLRYDFTGVKLTNEQKERVEAIVNEKIAAKLPVNQVILPRAEAEKTGARHFFGEKYGDQISVYFIGKDLDSAYSKEFCGGPHVKNTGELAGPEGKWKFKIKKEEASSQGVRRIKAVLD